MAKRSGALVWNPALRRGGNGVIAKANTGRKAVALEDGVGYTLACARESSRST